MNGQRRCMRKPGCRRVRLPWCRMLSVMLLVGLLAMGAVACASRPAEAPRVIRLAGGDWGYPSPFAYYPRGPGHYKMLLIFDTLLEKDNRGLIPWLASRWEVSPDGKVYTFFLQENARWHDGEPVTAADVAFTFSYYREHPPVWPPDLGNLEGVEVVDPKTVRFLARRAQANFLEEVGTVPIIPRHIWEGVSEPEKFQGPEALVGSGPFRLESFSKEQGSYRFRANPDFWGPKPLVDFIEFIPVADEVLALKNGDICLGEVPPDALGQFKDDPAYRVMRKPGFWGYRLLFQMQKVPFLSRKEARQALACAIDRQELVSKHARGAGVPGSPGIIPPDHVWYDPTVPQYPPDRVRALALLGGLGYQDRDGDGILEDEKGGRLALGLLTDDKAARLAEIVRQQLRAVGMEVKVEAVDMKTRDARVREGRFEMAITGHGGWGGDPDYLRQRFAPCGSGLNVAAGAPGYFNPRVAELAARQLDEIDPERRREIVRQLQHLLAEDLPELPLYMTTGYLVYRRALHDHWITAYDHHTPSHSKLSYLAYQAGR